jgi:hypothetical protein
MVTVATDTRQRHRRLDDEQACHRGRLLRELEAARYELKGTEHLALCGHRAHPPASQVIPPEEVYRPHTGEDWTTVVGAAIPCHISARSSRSLPSRPCRHCRRSWRFHA